MSHDRSNPTNPQDETSHAAKRPADSAPAAAANKPPISIPVKAEETSTDPLSVLPTAIAPIPEPVMLPQQLAEFLLRGNVIALRRRR